MSKRRQIVAVFVIAALVLLLACAPKTAAPTGAPVSQAPAPQIPPAAPVAPAVVAPTKAAWEVKWENVQEGAKKENTIMFGTSAGRLVERALWEGFKNKAGIRVESIGGSIGQLSSKIIAERRAGLYFWDVIVGGSGGQTSMLKPGGATVPLEPALILPDVTDPEVIKKVWLDGKLHWVDRDRHLLAATLGPSINVTINTKLVKAGEIKLLDDVLNPKWKGKILLWDPTQPGTKSDGEMMPFLYEVKGEAWVRKLAAQEPFIIGDGRLAMEWLAHGKYPILMPSGEKFLTEFIEAGAAIAGLFTDDAMVASAGAAVVSLIGNAPHPNAARVFINWYLSKEGQTVMSKAYRRQSARLDVPTDFLHPDQVRQPGVKYWPKDQEDVLIKIEAYREKSKQIFGIK